MIYKIYKSDNYIIRNSYPYFYHEYKNEYGLFYRDKDRPNMIKFKNETKPNPIKSKNKILVAEFWYNDEGSFSRDNNLPSYISYYKNRKIECVEYVKDGNFYIRPKNEANVIYYYPNGKVKEKRWYHKDGSFIGEQRYEN